MAKTVKFMCTAFRDGLQSAYGARVLIKDLLPAIEATREAGISYFEAGGGARFQTLYFYCKEDAFAMMDSFRETAGPDANLQTLARGINVVGLDSQSSDIIQLHARLFKKHGITTIRNFDALNDVDNLIYSGKCIVDAGLKHQVCITMMELPPGCNGAHDVDFYIKTLRQILKAEIPFDAICFKDASGTTVPSKVYKTIKQARKILPGKTFIHFHTHETAGIGVTANKAAIEGGADAIDLSMAPCSGGTSQPDILVMYHALKGSDYTLDIDIEKIRNAEGVLKDCLKDYFLPPEALAVDPLIIWSPMPGGALTANTQMLRDNGIMDKYPAVIKAMDEVVRRGGYGTSVTPVSQFYFQQAFNNVMLGPWKKIAEGYGKMVLGYFGKTPVPPDKEIVKIASEQLKLEPTKRPPIEINNEDPEKSIDHARKNLKEAGLEETDENIFIVATCKEKGITFLKGQAELGIRKIEPDNKLTESQAGGLPSAPADYTVTVNEKDYSMTFDKDSVTVNGKSYNVSIRNSENKNNSQNSTNEKKPNNSDSGAGIENTEVKAQMPGKVIRLLLKEGDYVHEGDSILILEAMKMEVHISSPVEGLVSDIKVAEGDQIAAGHVMATIN